MVHAASFSERFWGRLSKSIRKGQHGGYRGSEQHPHSGSILCRRESLGSFYSGAGLAQAPCFSSWAACGIGLWAVAILRFQLLWIGHVVLLNTGHPWRIQRFFQYNSNFHRAGCHCCHARRVAHYGPGHTERFSGMLISPLVCYFMRMRCPVENNDVLIRVLYR
jgi:hypothetical protein